MSTDGGSMFGGRSGTQVASVLGIIRRVRRRWRLRVLLRGLVLTGAGAFVAFLLSAWLLETARFDAAAVTGARVAAWSAVAVLAVFTLLRPLLRRLSDEQVALYIQEHEPSVEETILGAVEAEEGRARGEPVPDALLRSLVRRAESRAREVRWGTRIEQQGLYRYSGALAALALAGVAFLLLAPSGLRTGVGAVLNPTSDAAAVSPYAVTLEPGDVTVARGSDLFVRAHLRGFNTEEVYLFTRPAGGGTPQRLSMLPIDAAVGAAFAEEESGDARAGDGTDAGAPGGAGAPETRPIQGSFELLLLSLQEDTEYFVEADGIRSPTFTVTVAELPYVDRMDHTYRYPGYTGLQKRVVEDGGDVAAPAGTTVDVVVHPTLATPGGRIVLEGSDPVELAPGPDGTLTGSIPVRDRGFYRIELARQGGELVEASPRYTIDVIRDLRPSVSVTEPGRDAPVSPIEEVFIEAEADDDYGIEEVRLIWSVNGGPEDTTSVFRGSGSPLPRVTASHTLFLEEYPLEPGDVISYYAQARDERPGVALDDSWVTSDLYFLQIRPFRRDFRQAEQQGGGPPQGGGPGGAETALSELQRQVVVGTFNVLRDREELAEGDFTENLTTLALAQGRVREQVATLLQRMQNRGIAGADEQFREIAELLPESLENMERAEALLREGDPGAALPPEQEALRVLQKAEETYERFVGQQQQGGGGGGGQGANAEDLADLFELELDKLRNQYETVQRGERQQADAEVDELLERVKELARRQQQAVERQRQRAAAQQGASGGGDGQRSLAEETEETARQLERLARETGDRQLQETARRLQEAAESMRRSASSSGNSGGTAEAGSALDRLEEAERRLRRNRQDRMGEESRDALERAERLAESQDEILDDLDGLPEDPTERARELRDIVERKEEMLRETQALEQQIDRMAADARRDDAEAAREMSEAASEIRERKLKEKIAWSRGVVQERDREFARSFEEEIRGDIEALRDQMEAATRAAQRVSEGRSAEESLERARDLARAAESLERRMDGRGAEGEEPGRPGEGRRLDPDARDGAQGEAGRQDGEEQGQEGQQGQQGGQEGQQGQEGSSGGGLGDPTRESVGARAGDDSRPSGGATRGGDGRPYTAEEIRQYRRAFQDQLEEARELRRSLAEDGADVDELDRAMEAMESLTREEVYRDLPQIALLQETIRDNLKRVEFTLRREVEGEDAGSGALGASGDVPDGFRELVEEYYRSLARSGGGG